jgi:hypothetical protein
LCRTHHAGAEVAGEVRVPHVGIGRIAASVAIALALLLALWALGEALSVWIVVGVVAFAVIATIPSVGRVVLQSLCAAVVALLALVGFNVALGWVVEVLPDGLVDPAARLPIPVGLVVALAIFWSTAYFYLRGTWIGAFPALLARVRSSPWLRNPTEWSPKGSLIASGVLATVVILALPPAVALLRAAKAEEPGALPTPTRIGADLDVRIVAARPLPEPAEIPPDPARAGFLPAYRRAVDLDVRFAVGFADQATVRWTRVGMTGEAEARAALSERGKPAVPAPQRRPGADTIVVLLVDATPAVVLDPESLDDIEGEDDEVERWRSIAESVGAPELPVVALLQTSDEQRLRRWASFEDVGEVVSIKRFGSQTVTDAAVRLGVGRPTGADDFELAMRHRPILLFDADEPTPRPLSIEQLFKDSRVRQCDEPQSGGSCGSEPVRGPADLRSPGTYLAIDRPPGLHRLARRELEAWLAGRVSLPSGRASERPTGSATANAAQDGSVPGAPPPGTPPPTLPPGVSPAPADEPLLGAGSRMYVNAVPVRQGTRQLLYLDYWWYLADNPTRAVKGAFCGAGMVILGVTCFDHESDWEGMTVVVERRAGHAEPIAAHYAQHESVVRYDWPALRAQWDRDTTLEDLFARLPDHADRPVVWIARGTHAGYARRCDESCRQVAADLEERSHDGRLPWVGDDTAVCLRVGCLLPLPTAAGGRGPASWNAFAGPWGSRNCWLRYFCASATPPPAPGGQDRYRDPARYDGTGDVTDRDGGFEAKRP